jgi:muconolactone D-isomerase
MLFMVKMTVHTPAHLSEEAFTAIKVKEKTYAQDLQKQGIWRDIWRIVGQYANISIFEVKDNTHLHDILSNLPLFPFMSIEITPLTQHPSKVTS